MEEAGRTAADVEAKMRQRDRKGGFNKMDEIDEQEVEEYYRNRWVEEELVEVWSRCRVNVRIWQVQ